MRRLVDDIRSFAPGGYEFPPFGTTNACATFYVGVRRHWRVRFYAAAPARPTELALSDAAGQHSVRPHYESAQRASWRALREALEKGTPPAYTLDDLIADLSLTEHLLSTPPEAP